MKTTSDGIEVSSRSWYYLLDFNDKDNWDYMQIKFNKMKLHDLTYEEYMQLFKHAAFKEFN